MVVEAIIERVDGESPLRTAVIRIEPGMRELTLRGTDPVMATVMMQGEVMS